MSGIDIAIVIVIAVSMLVSFVRGFFREAIALLSWLGAVIITLFYTRQFATLLPRETIESQEARLAIAALILFFGSLFIGGLINWLCHKIIDSSQLGLADRMLGAVFGAMRGAIIVSLLVMLTHLKPSMQRELWWQQSFLIPRFDRVARVIHSFLPEEIGKHFDFSQGLSRS